MNRWHDAICGVLTAVTMVVLTTISAAAQAKKPPNSSQLSRTPDGQPDIQGAWTAPGAYGHDWVGTLEKGVGSASVDEAPRPSTTSGRNVGAAPGYWMVDGPDPQKDSWINRKKTPQLVVDPADGRIPLQPWAAQVVF